jgi:hypothetical protein
MYPGAFNRSSLGLFASSYVLTRESGGLRATHTVIELPFYLESDVALATRNRFSSGRLNYGRILQLYF